MLLMLIMLMLFLITRHRRCSHYRMTKKSFKDGCFPTPFHTNKYELRCININPKSKQIKLL